MADEIQKMFIQSFQYYGSGSFLAANGFIALNLFGALLLGMLVGYERSYQGRAAGMRTYGLVCMASAALTVFSGFAPLWFGGQGPQAAADPTHVVQGIVAGIGFLGAGVIMKDGLSIRGLTTAASIWAVAAVGVLIGVGLYPSALFFALLCALSMSLLHNLETRLPGRATLDVTLTFCPGFKPDLQEVAQIAQVRGYRVLRESVTITFADNQPVWRFAAMAVERSRALSPALLADELTVAEGVAKFTITPVRN